MRQQANVALVIIVLCSAFTCFSGVSGTVLQDRCYGSIQGASCRTPLRTPREVFLPLSSRGNSLSRYQYGVVITGAGPSSKGLTCFQGPLVAVRTRSRANTVFAPPVATRRSVLRTNAPGSFSFFVSRQEGGDISSASLPGGPLVVRFAPSPTGLLHVGGARTALLNFAFLKEHQRHLGSPSGSSDVCRAAGGGRSRLILRIEDTDEARSNIDTERALIEDLKWLGVSWDEGPDVGGPRGPYRQSERLKIYWQHGQELLRQGLLYRCFCSKARLLQLRQQCVQQGLPPRYDGQCRSLDPTKAEQLAAEGKTFALRFKIPTEPDEIRFTDILRGTLSFSLKRTLGDFVCFRPADQGPPKGLSGSPCPLLHSRETLSEGTGGPRSEVPLEGGLLGVPVYNFCAAVDDWLMGVTAVVRGEEHIPNTIAQMLVGRALGAPLPRICHLPVMIAKEGGKISKRAQSGMHLYFWLCLKGVREFARSREPRSNYWMHPFCRAPVLRSRQQSSDLTESVKPEIVNWSLHRLIFVFSTLRMPQLVACPNAEPLVGFFLKVVAQAPGVCKDATHFCQNPAAAPTATRGDYVEALSASLHVTEPSLFAFLSLAARRLLLQHTTPSAVLREFSLSLSTRLPMQVLGASGAAAGATRFSCPSIWQHSESGEERQFRAVAAAVVESGDLFVALSRAAEGTQEAEKQRGAATSKGQDEIRKGFPEGEVLQRFENWKDHLSRKLNLDKAGIMKCIRRALTGQETGLPLLQLLELLRAAEAAGLSPFGSRHAFSSLVAPQTKQVEASTGSTRGITIDHCGLQWIQQHKIETIQQRIANLEYMLTARSSYTQ
ncbi:putative glutamyl-tRNA synthetase [Cyclospora cayetanensis]|uniref:Glutamyl-tRNA synthetase n=1 Tax=Cyclospora cayetanensis TaxID=88456 RepID=A0A1D3D1N8_9EIME|nr:putative glutamyl-tRNA synthetase [Cyclospora cayetanensis]